MRQVVIFFTALFLLGGLVGNVWGQTVVYHTDFTVSQGESFTQSGEIGNSGWHVTRSGVDWGARIHGGILELTNTASDTTNQTGWVFAYLEPDSLTHPFSITLAENTEPVHWLFNMRQIRDNPAGFGETSYGVAFIIGATNDTIATKGNGYAVVLGNTGTPDPVRFVKYNDGIQSLGTTTGGLIVAGPPLENPTNRYMSIRLTFDPTDNSWSLYGRLDGATEFLDPLDESLVLLGSVVDTTFINTPLEFMGTYWQGGTAANQTAYFDNVYLIVGENIIEPPAVSNYTFDYELPPAIRINEPAVGTIWLRAVEPFGEAGYDRVRVNVEIEKPEGSTVTLIAEDSEGNEFDIAALGYWGPEDGFPIPHDYTDSTIVTGTFSHPGVYNISLKLVDLDNESAVITETTIQVVIVVIGWANLQWPPDAAIKRGETVTVYAQVWAENITGGQTAGPGISAYIGYHSEDTDPKTWQHWVPAVFNAEANAGNNDEYMAAIGTNLADGTYYYASRFVTATDTVYGGFQGGFWDGVNNVSGVLTVETEEVATIAELRTKVGDGKIYRLTGEAILTFNSTFRGRKAVQDATAGIVIDDPGGVITTQYERYDGITNLTGTVGMFNNLIQFVPVEDPGPASSSGNIIFPQPYKFADFALEPGVEQSPLQGQLVVFENVMVLETGTWQNQSDYTLQDEDGNTFPIRTDRIGESILYPGETQYIGTQIPDYPLNISGYITQYGANIQLVPRMVEDMIDARLIEPFSLLAPADGSTIIIEGEWFDEIVISWEPTQAYESITYTWIATLPGLLYHVPLSLPSDNDGAANSLTVQKYLIDEFLNDMGIDIGEQLTLRWTVVATSANGRKYANESFLLTLERGTITSVGERNIAIPTEYRLERNYPNPFNPQTTIRFALPEQSMVTLEIFNALGQRVRTLIGGEMHDPGYHTVVWDGTDQMGRAVSSGVYIYRLQAGSYTDVKKMMYLK